MQMRINIMRGFIIQGDLDKALGIYQGISSTALPSKFSEVVRILSQES
jgi:hypothetical protein